MVRRRMRTIRGSRPASEATRIVRMIGLLVILGLIYQHARKPETWTWLAPDQNELLAEAPARAEPMVQAGTTNNGRESWQETIIEGPTGEDGDERAEARRLFQAVTDKAPLVKSEMPAYWQLLKWALAEPMVKLEGRADRNAVFVQLFEEPDKFRGELIRLRLHIKRILKYDAPGNSAGIKAVYEIWGWTDDSRSYPYVVITSELPPGYKLGADVPDEGMFVGYFLKWMNYTAFDKTRTAPLLLGRIRRVGPASPVNRGLKLAQSDEWILWGSGGLIILSVAGWVIFGRLRAARQARPKVDRTQDLDEFFSSTDTGRPFGDFDANGLTAESSHDDSDRS